eukprot:TRINITY_DN9984_c0_g1_i1.p1 TRINITY_DN9984_c0_g1~~TRINITY_DN9984_c0_g1_i1.p1  ORF type:complete len:247 (+),score=23.88 TRINITY_DN9984_c0_g1_i1:89-742(+)
MAAEPRFQTYHEDWILSSYEENRTAQPLVDDDREVELDYTELGKMMKCAVCLNLLDHTMTTKDCIHRFCADCISKSLRFGKKECPTCRKNCASKRSLRKDERFDALIAAVYPDRDEFESYQAQVLKTLQDETNMQALQQSVDAGIKDQAANRKKARVYVSDDYAVPLAAVESGDYVGVLLDLSCYIDLHLSALTAVRAYQFSHNSYVITLASVSRAS